MGIESSPVVADDSGFRRLKVDGLGSLAPIELELGRLTVLVGPNGSGKSNLLRALRMLALMRTGSLQRLVGEEGGASSLLHYGPKITKTLTLSIEFVQEGHRNTYEAHLGHAAGDRLLYLDEVVGHQPPDSDELRTTSLGASHWESLLRDAKDHNVAARTTNYWLSRLTYFHFHDTSANSALRTNARLADDRYLRSDGSNLAAYLYRLANSEVSAELKAWRRINSYVRRISPAVHELAPTAVGESHARLDWTDDKGERFGCSQLSDGTLRAIALVTAFSQPISALPKLMSIDEPELGLHPAALQIVAELSRSVCHHSQVIFATQSTAFLDYFEPEEIRIVERRQHKSDIKRPEVEKLEEWLEDYSLGEVFQKGVMGGRP